MFFKQIPAGGGGGPMENCFQSTVFPMGPRLMFWYYYDLISLNFPGEKGVQHSLIHVIVVLNYSFKI